MAESRIRKFGEDEIIIKENEPHNDMYKLLTGKVALYFHYGQEDEYLIGAMGTNRCFGEFSFLTGKPEMYTVVAITEVNVLVIPESDFEEFIIKNHVNVLVIMKDMAHLCYAMRMNISMMMNDMMAMSNELERMAGLIPKDALAADPDDRDEISLNVAAESDKEYSAEPLDIKSRMRRYAIDIWESANKYQWRT